MGTMIIFCLQPTLYSFHKYCDVELTNMSQLSNKRKYPFFNGFSLTLSVIRYGLFYNNCKWCYGY